MKFSVRILLTFCGEKLQVGVWANRRHCNRVTSDKSWTLKPNLECHNIQEKYNIDTDIMRLIKRCKKVGEHIKRF